MLVKNLVPWAGHDFSYMPDQIVDLPDETAKARIAAGLAKLPEPWEAHKGDPKKLVKALTDLGAVHDKTTQRLADAEAEIADLKTLLGHTAIAQISEPVETA